MKLEEILGKEVFDGLNDELKGKYADTEFLVNNGNYIPKEKFDNLNETKKDLENQLKETNEKIAELSKVNPDELNQTIKDWQEKYDTDTKALQEKMEAREYQFKLENYVDEKFSSKSSRKAYMNDLKAQNLKFNDDGVLVGYDDFKKSYQENDPTAFAVEEPQKESGSVTVNTGVNHNDGDNAKQDLKLNSMFRNYN